LVKSNNYQKFDFGSGRLNRRAYGQSSPPTIPLGEVDNVPVAYFVGKYDTLGDPIDSAAEYALLKSGVWYKEYDDMDHFSFMSGKDTSFTNDMLAQIKAVAATEDLEELPMDYPFVEEASLNLY